MESVCSLFNDAISNTDYIRCSKNAKPNIIPEGTNSNKATKIRGDVKNNKVNENKRETSGHNENQPRDSDLCNGHLSAYRHFILRLPTVTFSRWHYLHSSEMCP